MCFKKMISLLIITSLMSMITYPLFSQNVALENAKSAASNSEVFDGKSTLYKASLPDPKATVQAKTESQEKSFAEKLSQDIKDNKSTYITTLATAGLLGFILGGPLGILVGIGAMFAFTVTQRADYINAVYK